ncbi:unnamed protein product [Arctia plantaginis]|uniref:DUF7869 domain-containing protein n=1 Tax=Arctia plantaginis TaxID=874455 RepID=A0A8S0ZQ63_ARCPL|nr:unnamed protein product [Arctia plantaginis]
MKTGRSKLMLKLVKETSEYVQITSSIHEECFDEEDCIPGTPAKIHGEVCNDFPGPNPDDASYSNCPSNNTAVSSCQSSPVPLIRCRGKKRVRNYGDCKEVRRKRLMNAGKEYSSKKGVIIPAKSIGYCYMWDESVAKRGANEVASCVYDFIKKFVSKGVKEFRFWSDDCAGQNRNRIVFGMYAHVAKEYNINITHRFLEKGHTQNQGDSVYSVIERTAEHKTIHTPDEWKLLVRWAKVTGDSYEVIDVNQALVFDFKDQLKNKNWVKNTANNKVTWTIQYKNALSDDYMTLILRKETRNYNTPSLHKAYVGPIPISKDKYKDLTSLCDALIIPTKYHYFFRNLIHGHNVSDDNNESD